MKYYKQATTIIIITVNEENTEDSDILEKYAKTGQELTKNGLTVLRISLIIGAIYVSIITAILRDNDQSTLFGSPYALAGFLLWFGATIVLIIACWHSNKLAHIRFSEQPNKLVEMYNIQVIARYVSLSIVAHFISIVLVTFGFMDTFINVSIRLLGILLVYSIMLVMFIDQLIIILNKFLELASGIIFWTNGKFGALCKRIKKEIPLLN